jgi:4-amino-4-deoxy-L-arabinose transferase-like glycosyltransferase
MGDHGTPARNDHPQLEWLIPALFCAALVGQLLLSSRQLSQTADEATHLYSGYRYLKCGDLSVSPEHPPFAKAVEAAPLLLLLNPTVDCEPVKGDGVQQSLAALTWLYSHNWTVALASGRIAASIFAAMLCVFVWITAREMFGAVTAIVASLLLIFEPNVLAYGSLVLTDIPVTCMMLLTVLCFYRWVKYRTVPVLLLTGLAAGLALLSKHSGVIALPVLGMLAITDAFIQFRGDRPKWKVALDNALAVAFICVVAAGVVWTGYGIRFAMHPAGSHLADAALLKPSSASGVLLQFEKYRLLPQPYLQGFGTALTLSNRGDVVFAAGKIYLHAPWFATAFNFLIHNTTAMLGMIVMGIFGIALTLQQQLRERLFLLVPLVVYLAVCVGASRDVSIRYLLPMLPFLLLAVAEGCVALARRVPSVKYALLCLILLHASSSLRAYPNYLSYANELWGGPARAYQYLPWLDTGQAYPEAKAYLEQHPQGDCWFITGWQWDPALDTLPCQTFGLYLPHQIPSRVHGTIIVSSTLLTDVRPAERELSAAFQNATPVDHIGGSALLVYKGDFDTSLDSAVGERNLATYSFGVGQFAEALQHGRKAAALGPVSAITHADLCFFLARFQVDEALKECYAARNLMLRDPLREEQIRQQYSRSLDLSIAALRKRYQLTYGRDPEIASITNNPKR